MSNKTVAMVTPHVIQALSHVIQALVTGGARAKIYGKSLDSELCVQSYEILQSYGVYMYVCILLDH
jgi:hypothetical protein